MPIKKGKPTPRKTKADALAPSQLESLTRHLESISGQMADIALALQALADATAMSVIANSGVEGDRARAVGHLKDWFENSRH